MRRFRERNLAYVGLVSILVIVVLIAGALNFSKLPLASTSSTHEADFADAGGLAVGNVVTVDGVKVGAITHMALRGDRVRVTFTVQRGVHLGDTTSAAAKVLSPIGTEYLELSPAGTGPLLTAIPSEHTSLPYNLVADLSQLGQQIQGYNIPALKKALETGGAAVAGTPAADAASAFDGLARFSQVLGRDQASLATIVDQGAGLTKVLSDRSGQLVDLVSQSDVVLQVLTQRKAAIQQLLDATSSLSQQITSILANNKIHLSGLLNSLQTVSSVLAQNSADIGQALPVLAAFSRYAANSTGSGPFADVSVPTLLLPDNFLAQCAAPGSFPSANPQVGCRR